MRSARPLQLSISRRWTSTAAANAQHNTVLTLLHKASNVLPRTLPPSELAIYEQLFDASRKSLTTKPNVARVTLYPVDEWAKWDARSIITALLQEPFASDDSQNKAIRERQPSGLIKYGSNNSSSSNTSASFVTPSSFLSQFSTELEISELGSSPAEVPLLQLLDSDIPILVCNPLTTSLDSLSSITDSSITIVFASCSSISPELEYYLKEKLQKHDLLFVDPSRAVRALSIVRGSGMSSSAVQRYQDAFIDSKLSSITHLIHSALSHPLEYIHARTAFNRLASSILACEVALNNAHTEVNTVIDRITELRDAVDHFREVERDIIYPGDGIDIREALNTAKRDMKPILDGLSLRKLVWRVGVDDVGEVVGGEVQRKWCRSLEDLLILHTGRLAALQQTLDQRALSVVSDAPIALRSEVLLNALHQLSPAAPSPSSITPISASLKTHSIPSDSLTAPIHHRRSQLIAFPTSQLHVAAQRAVLSVFAGMSTGAGVGMWWVWNTTMMIAGDAAVGAALGVGVALTAVRWGVGLWARAKRQWWDDWDRIGAGLERDLKNALLRTMNERVFRVSNRACDGLEEVARRRLEEVREVRSDVRTLKNDIAQTQSHSSSK